MDGGKVINNKCTASNSVGGVSGCCGARFTRGTYTISGNTPTDTGGDVVGFGFDIITCKKDQI